MSSQESVARTGDVLCLTASQRLRLQNRAEPVRKAVSQLRAAVESAFAGEFGGGRSPMTGNLGLTSVREHVGVSDRSVQRR